MRILPLFPGFPGSCDRGFLGWSSCVLLLGDRPYLFDTLGYPERYALLDALAGHGVTPEEVAGVFLSHLHFDHAVNYRLFPNAELYLHEAELAYARREYEDDLAVPIEVLGDLEATGRLRLLSGERGTRDGMDWFRAPGHTAGLVALRIEGEGGTTILASDAVKNLGELITGESPRAWDGGESRRTILGILASADVIVPGHDRVVHVHRDPDTLEVRLRTQGSAAVHITVAADVPAETRDWTVRID